MDITNDILFQKLKRGSHLWNSWLTECKKNETKFKESQLNSSTLIGTRLNYTKFKHSAMVNCQKD